ncbi:hypothetical protein DPMN_114378 [Dreissena polymorpha]|uniref:Uncharacterized protein n=1 Tax=Dreissena polymorpha TaxID=45954 RepID=A0A9D4KJ82_DREPO|nr:hypothetical protein DPMN_114378 [Dreissena polymorpha]
MWCITTNTRSNKRHQCLLTRFCYSHTSGHVFQRTSVKKQICPPWRPSFSTIYIIKTYVLTKFREDSTINVNSSANNLFLYFDQFRTRQRYHWTTFLTKFHDNQAINVTFRVLTRKNVDDALRTNGDP